jgi:nitroreductase
MKPGLYGADQDGIGEVLLEDDRICQRLCEAALEDQPWVAEAAFVVAVCGDFKLATDVFAEQPPVGSRGARYVYLEAGAMMQNMQLSGVGLGLAGVPVAGFDDEQVAAALELPSGLSPVVLLCCGWASS